MSHLGRSLAAARWRIVGLVGAGALGLGITGFIRQGDSLGVAVTLPDAIYRSLQLFVLEWGGLDGPVPLPLNLARFLAPAVAGVAAVQAIALVLHAEVERVRLRWFARGHIVVCGDSPEAVMLARALRRSGRTVALVAERPPPGIAVGVAGDPGDALVLRRAAAHRSAHLIALCGNDGANATVVAAARRLGEPGPTVHMQVRDPGLATLLRTEAVAAGSPALELHDLADEGARALLAAFDDRPTALVVVGSSPLARGAATEAAGRLDRGGLERLVVADDGDVASELRSRFPGAGDRIDGAAMEVAALCDAVTGHAARSTGVAVCCADEGVGLVVALGLVQALKQQSLESRRVEIIVHTAHASRLGDLAAGAYGPDAAVRLRGFDLEDAVLGEALLRRGARERIVEALGAIGGHPARSERSTEATAAVVSLAVEIGPMLHEVGCDLVPLHGAGEPLSFTPGEVDLLGLLCLRHWHRCHRNVGERWHELEPGRRDRIRNAVRRLPEALAMAGQRVIRLDRSPARMLHEAYVARRRLAGEDPGSNPSLVPWDALPEALRASNRDQVAHLRVKLEAIGCDLVVGDGPSAALTEAESELLAEMEHERWLVHRREAGVRPGVRTVDGATSPHLVPWADLDESIRDLDREFVRSIPDLAAALGRRVERLNAVTTGRWRPLPRRDGVQGGRWRRGGVRRRPPD